MTRQADPKSKSGINIKPTNDEEVELLQQLRQICKSDGLEIRALLFPAIRAIVKRRSPSNPQTLLDPTNTTGRTLSNAQRERLDGKPDYGMQEIDCLECQGKGCRKCNQLGKIGVEATK